MIIFNIMRPQKEYTRVVPHFLSHYINVIKYCFFLIMRASTFYEGMSIFY